MICFVTLLLAFGCSQTSQQDKGKAEQQLGLALLSVLYLESGNCARSYRFGTNWGQLYCSRAPRSLCEATDGYFTLSPLSIYGKILVTSANQSYYTSQWGFYASDYAGCTGSVATAASLSDPGFKLSTSSQQTRASSSFSFNAIGDCGTTSNANLGKLITEAQLKFLISPLGVLAWQARATGQNTCYNNLPLTAAQRQLVEDYAAGNSILETSCNYGSSAAPNNCTSAEKAMATSFDFTGSL